MLLVLPGRPRRAHLKAFWLVMSLWTAAIIGVAVPRATGTRMIAASLAAAAVLMASAVFPRAAVAGYRFCARGSRVYARVARASMLALCYAIIFAVVGRAGTRLRLRRPAPGDSLWEAARTLSPDAYRSQSGSPGMPWTGRPWTAMTAWAIGSDNLWAIVLLPFLAMVAVLEVDDHSPFPSSGIYTLF